MSRAYRIRVRESLQRDLHAEDGIHTQIELLEVLPAEQMGALLEAELKSRGFEESGGKLVRRQDGVTVAIDPCSGEVVLKASVEEKVELQGQREGFSYDDAGPAGKSIEQNLKKELKADLEKRAGQVTDRLQQEATQKLENHLPGLQQELNQAVNRVTAEALKQKAASMGQIKEMTEDPQTGSLSITLEV